MKRKMLIWITIFLLILFLGFESASVFYPKHRLGESAILLVRKHVLPQQRLNFGLNLIYKIYSHIGNLVTSPLFPAWIRIHWWDERLAYLFICLPIIIVLTSLIVLPQRRKIVLVGLVLTLLWLVPVTKIIGDSWDKLIINTHWDLKYPWSKSLVWIWRYGDDNNIYPYTSFRYEWNQKYSSSTAKILVSCLGDYQLIVNGESLYHGPSYAVPPRIYYDQIDIGGNIRKGRNEILIVCNYSNEKYHQHATYPSPGLLVGGEIKDGIITHNLADSRLWQTARNDGWKNGVKISPVAAYSEEIDLTKDDNMSWKTPEKIDFKEYIPEPRQTPLLVEKKEPVNDMGSGVYDLGRTMVGYLTAKGSLEKNCTLSVSWGDKLTVDKKIEETSQDDKIVFTEGEINWEQFSRRSGRYIQIDKSACENELELGFKIVGMPFVEPKITEFGQEIDQQIYELAINTLKNNVQDHFEDSVVREKAMYIGDAREVSRCLMVNGDNSRLVSQMIRQFAQGQNNDGLLPAMSPSGDPIIIYDYVFQWVVWVDDYLTKTKDASFAKEMWPTVEKVMNWAEKNAGSQELLDTKWQVFIDWSPIDRSKQFITGFQIWYYQALRSAALIAKEADQPEENFTQQADKIEANLLKYGYDSKTGLFVDSFSLEEQSKGESLVTNALAGSIGIFPPGKSEEVAKSFGEKLYTADPFSESWVVEWLLNVGRRDTALETMRNYWGGMIKDGATTIYEYYTPGTAEELSSYSHAWGCGPIYLYKEILKP